MSALMRGGMAVMSDVLGLISQAQSGVMLASFGVGQSWADKTALRDLNVNYTNTTGKALFLSLVGVTGAVGNYVNFFVKEVGAAGDVYIVSTSQSYAANGLTMGSVFIPVGATYKAVPAGVVIKSSWMEYTA